MHRSTRQEPLKCRFCPLGTVTATQVRTTLRDPFGIGFPLARHVLLPDTAAPTVKTAIFQENVSLKMHLDIT